MTGRCARCGGPVVAAAALAALAARHRATIESAERLVEQAGQGVDGRELREALRRAVAEAQNLARAAACGAGLCPQQAPERMPKW